MKKKAFTLAETLITLMVIGVVAVLTLPAMFQNYKDIKYKSAYKKMHSAIINGFNRMIAEETMSGHESTEDFVSEMGKYFKITSTCGNDNLQNCFAEKITTDDDVVDISKIKTSKNLGKDWDTDTNVNGLMLDDGTSMLVAYNKDGCLGAADSREEIINSCVAIVYDLDNKSNGNKLGSAGSNDIGLYNASFNSSVNCGEIVEIGRSGTKPTVRYALNGADAQQDECAALLSAFDCPSRESNWPLISTSTSDGVISCSYGIEKPTLSTDPAANAR
ncbi:MAG: type II secretion system GspH family protein [bacterium]|nr:type II secretion system GspH family protein [bacterium]